MRGKTRPAGAPFPRPGGASMRPPQNAGENRAGIGLVERQVDASMRPPQNAGENPKRRLTARMGRPSFNEAPAECGGKRRHSRDCQSFRKEASMRPPQNAGENAVGVAICGTQGDASMRPPQNAGENCRGSCR